MKVIIEFGLIMKSEQVGLLAVELLNNEYKRVRFSSYCTEQPLCNLIVYSQRGVLK